MNAKSLAGCLMLGLAACQPSPNPGVLGTIERDRLELSAEANEPIAELLVHEGDRVTVGQVLLRQAAGAMQPRLEQAQAQVDKARQQLSELQHGPRREEIADARAQLASANSAMTAAELDFTRAQQLAQAKAQSQALLDQARATRDAAVAAHQQAQLHLQLLKQGTRSEQLEQAKATLAAMQAAVAELQISATRYAVTAPRAGVIEALPYKVGERPPISQPVVIMLVNDRVYARVYVPEALRTQFTAGKPVMANVDGVANPFKGIVRYISAQAAFTPYFALTQQDRGRLSYLTEIDLQDAQALPTGLPVEILAPP